MTFGDGDATDLDASDLDVGTHPFDADEILGVRVVRDRDPEHAARQLAEELHAEVVRDLDHAERAFAARAEAGRAEAVVLGDDERRDLEARAAVADATDAVDDAMLRDLRELAGELQVTSRIRANTEAEMTETLNRRLSATSGVAVHPTAIRQAAAQVTDAEADLADCDASLRELGERPVPARFIMDDDPFDGGPSMFDEEGLEQNRRAVGMSMGVAAMFAGAALVLLSTTSVPVVVDVVLFVVGVVLAVLLAMRNRRTSEHRDLGEEQASALLAQAAGGDLAAPAPAPAVTEQEWLSRRAQLDAARERALERLRAARRHWESLAGVDADPHDVDSLLRVRDPQFELIGSASKTSPTVRSVSAVHRRVQARWRVAWAAVGYDEPPPLDEIDEHLARLSAGGDDTNARARLQAADAWAAACETIDAPIVLVRPADWLPATRLAELVKTLPAGAEVIVVDAA